MKRLLGAIGLAAALASPWGHALADEIWDGPRLSAAVVYGTGTGINSFATDGFFNDAPGDMFSYAVGGVTMGITGGYDWSAGPFVYGFGMTVFAGNGGVSNYDIPSPYDPDQDFELKFHWGGIVDARLGFAIGRTLFYVQAGPGVLHLISQANDDPDGRVRLGRWPFVLSAGVGIEQAVTDRMSVGLGYRYFVSAPARIYANDATPTDYTVQYRAHYFHGGITLRFDRTNEAGERGLAGFDWAGAYVGVAAASPMNFVAAAGYNFVVADRIVLATEVRASYYACCNLRFGGDLLGRAGVVLEEDLLVYTTAGVRWRDDWFALVGGGFEIAMTPRISGMMELTALHRFGGNWGEIAFMGGFRFHLGGAGTP